MLLNLAASVMPTTWVQTASNHRMDALETEWVLEVGNGKLGLWIDDVLRQTLSRLSKEAQVNESVWLGPRGGIDMGNRGVYCLDGINRLGELNRTVIKVAYDQGRVMPSPFPDPGERNVHHLSGMIENSLVFGWASIGG